MEEQISYYSHKLSFEIDSWDLYDSISKSDKIKVIDTRSNEAYTLEHIPDSLNLPHREITEAISKSLDKDTLYVCYCDGIGCNASTKGALKIASLGFQVKELIGGLDWWKKDGYQTIGDKGHPGKAIVCGC